MGAKDIVSGKKRVLASAFAGTTIEWYDFYLYGTAAALIFNVQFFPMATELGGIVASFATLAVGVIARPLGGIIAGHLGDRIGRKALLVASLVLMGVASTLIGLMPTFEVIGWWAVVGLVILRILQGLSAGAEWGGSALLSVEHAPARHRGFFGSFTQIGSSAGMLLATGAFFIMQNIMSAEQFAAFGWRIPFLLSALLVAVGLWIRLGVADAPEFLEHQASGNVAKAPLKELLVHHRRPLLVTIGLRLAQNAIYYLITVYMLTYLRDVRGDSSSGVTAVMVASAIGLLSTPFWGWLSDRIGRRLLSAAAYAAIGVFGWVLFAFLDAGPLAFLPLVVILGINLIHDAIYGPQAAWFAEQFPVHVRYSGVSLGYQVGTVLGGGLMPMIAALLFAAGGEAPWLIAGYLTVLSVISVAAALAAKDPASQQRGTELTDLHAVPVVGDPALSPELHATAGTTAGTATDPERPAERTSERTTV
ncbi:MFS transporter [Citricoccus alkalitolerans]|uniref:MFS transporter n=1 Tax=Citricoccus alkalitolerans TaxID=246603 RepID=A0ABV8XX95_9MICC